VEFLDLAVRQRNLGLKLGGPFLAILAIRSLFSHRDEYAEKDKADSFNQPDEIQHPTGRRCLKDFPKSFRSNVYDEGPHREGADKDHATEQRHDISQPRRIQPDASYEQ
jgi:hypothetical protein